MELRRIDTFLFKCLYFAEAGIIVTQVLEMDSLISMLFMLTFPLTGLLWLRSVCRTVTGTDMLMLGTVALAVLNVLLSTAVSGGHISGDYLKKLIMLIIPLLFLQTVCRIQVEPKMVQFINRIVDVLTLFLIVMYFTRTSHMYAINGQITKYLTFNFGNPNGTAQCVINLFMLEFYRLFTKEKWYIKLLHIGMAAFLAFFIWETRSRNAQLVLLLYSIMCAWLIFHSRKKLRISGLVAGIIAWFPALFAAAYMYFISARWLQKLFAFMVEEGKGLDSRVRVWGRALNYIMDSPLIGSYYPIFRETAGAQMHNTHLEIAASYGLVVLVLVCSLLTGYIYRGGRICRTKQGMSYILGFCGSVLVGIGEAALFSGGLGIYVFAGTYLLMLNASEEEGESLQ